MAQQRRGSTTRGSAVGRSPARTSGTRGAGPVVTGRAGTGRTAEASRGPARPAGRRTAVGQGAAGSTVRTQAQRPAGLTSRAAVLVMVLLALLLAYAYPVRVYLGQQAQINSMESQQESQRRRIGELAQLRAKWNDPEYVKAQARDRLLWTVDGETPYRVVGGPPRSTTQSDDTATPPPRPRPWYGKLWSSVAAADRP